MATRRASAGYERSVFINCPFDKDYESLLRPLLFTIVQLGFNPRIASERSNSGENRMDKIVELMRASRYSIHDISRIRAKTRGEFARFNLPFELGVDRGAQLFGAGKLRNKRSLLLDSQPFEYKRALSDLSGVDIKHHENTPTNIVLAVRNWFVDTVDVRDAPSASKVWNRFTDFTSYFYDSQTAKGFSDEDLNSLPVAEYMRAIKSWVAAQANLTT